MTREEFNEVMVKFSDAVFDGGIANAQNNDLSQHHHFATSEVWRSKIMSEFDRLTAELDRLRWHYPSKGELPERDEPGEDISVIYEHSCGQMGITTKDRQPDVYFFENRVTRWRYIEYPEGESNAEESQSEQIERLR
jgi:hypothetical protein